MNWEMTENLESVFMICKYLTLHKRKNILKMSLFPELSYILFIIKIIVRL